jgi:hypothetical protein
VLVSCKHPLVIGEQGDAQSDSDGTAEDAEPDSIDADADSAPPVEAESESAPPVEAVDESAPPVEAESEQSDGQAPEDSPVAESRYRKWRRRDSIGELRRMASTQQARWREYDQRDNDATRLPPDEKVHLGGLVLAEAFTPSTASNLRKALEEFPESNEEKQNWLRSLADGRRANGGGGWSSLGVIRRSGTFGIGSSDPTLPQAVNAVWLHMHFLMPPLTMIVATFTIKDEEGDLSPLLRADYETTVSGPRIEIQGRLSRLRRNIPWSRPKLRSAWWTPIRAEAQKAIACESKITDHEIECWKWISRRFPGVFTEAGREKMPVARLLITHESIPFQDHEQELSPIDLASRIHLWNSKGRGWKLSFPHRPQNRENMIIVATRARDAARSPGGGIPGDSIWYLTQVFADTQSSLIARWALSCLLSLYADRLSSIRDQAGRQLRLTRRLRFRRPVREARDLDDFLIRDGLDSATIISDTKDFTSEPGVFSLDAPAYEEDLTAYPSRAKISQPRELAPTLRLDIRNQTERLNRDTEAATSNIAASAELRQSIANTRLQRSVIVLTVIAVVIALASLYVSLHSGSGNDAPLRRSPASHASRPSNPPATSRSTSPRPKISSS